jgi:hypothetical protein
VLSLNGLRLDNKTLKVSLRLLQVSGSSSTPFVSKTYAIAVRPLQCGVSVQELEDALLAREEQDLGIDKPDLEGKAADRVVLQRVAVAPRPTRVIAGYWCYAE